MKVRYRLIEAVEERVKQHMPEVLTSAWGEVKPVIFLTNILFQECGGIDGFWALNYKFQGDIVIEFRHDALDDFNIDDLIASLFSDYIHIDYDEAAKETGQLTEKARLNPRQLNEIIRDGMVVAQVKCVISGVVAHFDEAPSMPSEPAFRVVDGGLENE